MSTALKCKRGAQPGTMSALLRQPGGFEGFGPVAFDANRRELERMSVEYISWQQYLD